MLDNTQFSQQLSLADGDNNRIDEVVVFTDQAYIKRHIKTSTQAGTNHFLVEINAFHVDKDSVQANVYGHGEILTVQYRQIPLIEAVQNDVRELENKKRQLDSKKKLFQGEKEALNKQQKFLDSTISYADTEIPKELKTEFPSIQNLQNILQFLDENYSQFNQKKAGLDEQIQQLDDELLLIQRKLKQLKKPSQINKQYIEILFVAEQQENIQIDVFYIAGNAHWKPIYKVDATAELIDINLTTFAQIEQVTGENWSNVKLSISNSVPLKGGKLPDQNSWYLHLSSTQYPQHAEFAEDIAPADVMLTGACDGTAEFDELSVLEAPVAAASFAQAEKKELPLAFEFELPQKVNIKSGSGETLLPTSSNLIKGDFFHLCMPRQDPLVYLVCEALIENTLLPGKLNIYFAGRFVASSYLSEKQAGQKLLINLGADRDVNVNREKKTDKLVDSFFGVVDRLSAVREFAYTIHIENLKNKQITMRLIDAMPISNTDRIQIKELKYSPKPTIKNWQQREGVMLWDMFIGAKMSKELITSFFVKYPKDDPPYEI
jgi:uncharacterized protein (TIGR02231 family)